MIQERTSSEMEIKIRVGRIVQEENEIVVQRYNDDTHLTVDDIVEIGNAMKSIFSGNKFRLLVIPGKRCDVESNARKYDIEKDGQFPHMVRVEAVVVEDLPTRIAAHFYYMFRKPPHPNRVFANETKAREWLMQF